MSHPPADHELLGILREVPGQRRVLRTRLAGVECVTRVLLAERIHPNQLPLVRQVVSSGRGSLVGVPESVALTLEGYRVAARMHEHVRVRTGGLAWWPKVLTAGLTSDLRVYITTTFLPGTPLHELSPERVTEVRVQVALDVLEILGRLHAEHVAYGDLKTENVVVGPDGRAALIDIDTMREVPDVATSVVTRDLTRSWAAPEQERGQQTFLASDVWAWAELVRRLFPDGPPVDWQRALLLCESLDPLRRPHTVALLAALPGRAGSPVALWDWHGGTLDGSTPTPTRSVSDGPPVESTERVPEPTGATPVMAVESTERVADVVTGPPPTAALPIGDRPHPAPSDSPMTGCLQLVWGVSALATVVCLGFGGWGLAQYATSASDRIAGLEAALEAYKTDPALNTPSQREELDRLGEHHAFAYEPPRWLALAGLAHAWAAGWQDSGRTWKPEDEERARRIFDELGANDQPEAHLALATAQAAWCRVRPQDLTTGAHCDAALDEVAAFLREAPSTPDLHWMRVEATWTDVLVRSHLADDAAARALPPDQAAAVATAGLERCDAAEPWLPYAPVNNGELLEDCLVLAGVVSDLDRYRVYAGLLLGTDPPPLDRSTLKHLYTAAGRGCTTASLDKRKGEWVAKGDPWCLAVGHYARGCVAASLDVISRNAGDGSDRPWATLQEAVAGLPGTTLCAR